MLFAVIGTPRSGTKCMSDLFTNHGYPCNHEAYFGCPAFGTWYGNAQGESSSLALPYAGGIRKQGGKIIHIIRDPMKTVSSIIRKDFLSDDYFDKSVNAFFFKINMPELVELEEMDRYLYFWAKWNLRCERAAHKTFKIEDVTKNPNQVFEFLGMEIRKPLKVDKKANHLGRVKQRKLKEFRDCKHYDLFVKTANHFKYDLK
jgi:hypothetical protein